MEYQTYDELIALVAEFRLEHRNLTDDELDRLVKQTFRIDQATLREMGGFNGNEFILGKSHLKSQILWGKQDNKLTKIFFIC
mgnify:CR=1 FL=1